MSQWAAITALQSELNRVTNRKTELTILINKLRDKIDELIKRINEYDAMIKKLNESNSYISHVQSEIGDSLMVFDLLGETDTLNESKEDIYNISGKTNDISSNISEAIREANIKKEELQKEKEEFEKQKKEASDEWQRYNEVAINLHEQINNLMSSLD